MSDVKKPSMDGATGRTIILGVSGSIAAYKAADLTSRLVKRGHDVFVVLTESAAQFVGPITFQTLSRNPVTCGVFDERESWRPTHVDLADRADLFLIAPATANVIAKLANGLADDALTTLALVAQAPVLVAPAMNGKMWEHPATQQNIAVLKTRNVEILEPESGLLACGYEGFGRLRDIEQIAAKADEILLRKS